MVPILISETSHAATLLNRDLQSFVAAEKPELSVTVISPWTLFRSNLSQEPFERLIATTGPDYVLEVRAWDRARRVAQVLLTASLVETGRGPDELDIRYRIIFSNGGRPLLTLYVDAHGAILHDGKVLAASTGEKWLNRIWDLLEQDVVLSERVPPAPSSKHRSSAVPHSITP
jgi:hypothetical protein